MLAHARSVAVCLLLIASGCKTVGQVYAESEGATCAADPTACLDRLLERHGGLEKFRAHRYAQYSVTDDFQFPISLVFNPWPGHTNTLIMTADRTNGRSTIHFPGSQVVMGVDERGGWSTQQGLAHGSVKIGTLTSFELTLPFRLADEGVKIERVYAERWHDFAVVTMDVRLDPNVTRAGNAQWSIHIEPRTHSLLGATFFFTEDKATVDLEYQQWHLLDGVLVPKVISVDISPIHAVIRTLTVTQVKLFDTPPAEWMDAPPGAEREEFAHH